MRLPLSLGWFLLTGIVFVLQAIPIVGIFLMFMLAPFWSVLLVNLGFLGIGAEALVGRVSRLWLLVPVLFYGGYAGAAWQSRVELDRIDAALAARNAPYRYAFDANREALVFTGSTGEGADPQAIARDTLIPVAYSRHDSQGGKVEYRAHRIGDEAVCKAIRGQPGASQAGIFAFGYFGSDRYDRRPAVCQYYTPQAPAGAEVRVSSTLQRNQGAGLAPYSMATITVAPPARAPFALQAGWGAPLRWFPMPVIGCMLNSGAPSWDCDAGFLRGKMRGLGGAGGYGAAANAILVKALALRPAPADRLARGLFPPPPDLSRVAAAEAAKASAALDRIIADTGVDLTYHDVAALYGRPRDYRSRAPQMAAALGRGLGDGYRSAERVRVLANLLAQLPQEDFTGIGPSLLASLAARAEPRARDIDGSLTARLGDLGAAALPVLDSMAPGAGRRWGDDDAGVLLGWCRIGAPAAARADRVFAALSATRRTDTAHAAAFVTLLRLGRPDLADRDPDAASRYRKPDYDRLRAEVTAASPRNVCKSFHDWPKLPG